MANNKFETIYFKNNLEYLLNDDPFIEDLSHENFNFYFDRYNDDDSDSEISIDEFEEIEFEE